MDVHCTTGRRNIPYSLRRIDGHEPEERMYEHLGGRDEEVDGDQGEEPAHQGRGAQHDSPLSVSSLREPARILGCVGQKDNISHISNIDFISN